MNRRLHAIGKSVAVAVAMVIPAAAVAQAAAREPSAADVATSLRSKGVTGPVRAALTQAWGPRSRSQLDEIADTLVVIATRLTGVDDLAYKARREAVLALAAASRGTSGVVGADLAIPYGGGPERLRRIAAEGFDAGTRGAALSALMSLPDRAANVSFLEQLVLSGNEVAVLAVTMLGNDTGPAGEAVARRLYRENRLTDELVRQALSGMAKAKGW